MKPEDIQSLWIRYNEDDNTYSIDIETKDMQISFPRTHTQFLCGQYTAFPIRITTLDENMNTINDYAIISNNKQNTTTEQANQVEQVTPEDITDIQEQEQHGEGNS